MPDNAETALHALIEESGDDGIFAMMGSAVWLKNHGASLLAEREKDRARIERLERATTNLIEACRLCGIGSIVEVAHARAALTDTRALLTTEAQNG